jgi:tetratricopeptide (TPR) repeat protein
MPFTSPFSEGARQSYSSAQRDMEAGQLKRARATLEDAVRSEPGFGLGCYLLGLVLAQLGETDEAERRLRQAVRLDKRDLAAHAALADLLVRVERPAEAEKAYRVVLAADRRNLAASIGLARLLIRQGRSVEAVQITTPVVSGPNPSPLALQTHTGALAAAGRLPEAVANSRRAAAAGAPNAEMATAALLRDLGQYAQAENAYRLVLARLPDQPNAVTGLAKVIFSRTGDIDAALAEIDRAQQRNWSPFLATSKAKMLEHVGRSSDAYALLEDALRRCPSDISVHAAAATAAGATGAFEAAYAHAARALAMAPNAEATQVLLAVACLGSDRPDQAAGLIEPLRQRRPLEQLLISLEAVAQRLMEDARYPELYDYGCFVRAYTLEPPKGWSSLDGFLQDLAAHFHDMHDNLGEPLDQSLRQGSQTTANMVHSEHPLVKALFHALEQPIHDYMSRVGSSDDPLRQPLRARNVGGFDYKGAWSVRLGPGGIHVNHIHPDGWLSSAFYIELPASMDGDGPGGWIKFGEPSMPTATPLAAEHYVKPEAGRLVLFPSYMWHGTVPFDGEDPRLSFAFDVASRGVRR